MKDTKAAKETQVTQAMQLTQQPTIRVGSIAVYQPYNVPHTRMRTYLRKGNLPNKGEKRQRGIDGCYLNLSNAGLGDGCIWTEESSVVMQVLAEYM
jgi:hypothetical protein